MKFMKLGSKPDVFRTDETDNSTRYVDMELASDITIIVGEVKFHLHKFPLLSKSSLLQSLATTTKSKDDDNDEVHVLENFPGGPTNFELCAKFCYGMTVTLNAHNVVKARCAAEFLGMHETIEKGNLVYKIDAFFNSCILRSWKESIIALQTSRSMLPLAEDLKLVSLCVASISSMASIHTSKVDWCYTYNRKKPIQGGENDLDFHQRVAVPKDWWVEDLSELEMAPFERVIEGIKNKGLVCDEIIGDAIKAYAYKNLPVPTKGVNHFKCNNVPKVQCLVESIVRLLPLEKGSVSCSFLLKLLKVSLLVDLDEEIKTILVEKIGQQLDEATVGDLLIEADPNGESKTKYDVEVVERIIHKFLIQDQDSKIENQSPDEAEKSSGISSEVSLLLVVKLIDAYLAEVARDPNLPASRFLAVAEMINTESRQAHDALYRAIDMYIQEHPGMSKSEKKNMCKLIDCKKLSIDACTHAVQNERLPMRMIIQILFNEQARAAVMASSGSSTPDLPLPNKLLSLHNGSARSAPPESEDWDAVAAMEEMRTLKVELAAMGGSGSGSEEDDKSGGGESKTRFEKMVLGKMKGLLIRAKKKNKLRKMWSNKSFQGEINGEFNKRPSFSSSSNFHEEVRSTPARVQSRISIS
ncbi:hypothetical protein V2J09_019656 [Rumex salicifolius]